MNVKKAFFVALMYPMPDENLPHFDAANIGAYYNAVVLKTFEPYVIDTLGIQGDNLPNVPSSMSTGALLFSDMILQRMVRELREDQTKLRERYNRAVKENKRKPLRLVISALTYFFVRTHAHFAHKYGIENFSVYYDESSEDEKAEAKEYLIKNGIYGDGVEEIKKMANDSYYNYATQLTALLKENEYLHTVVSAVSGWSDFVAMVEKVEGKALPWLHPAREKSSFMQKIHTVSNN